MAKFVVILFRDFSTIAFGKHSEKLKEVARKCFELATGNLVYLQAFY